METNNRYKENIGKTNKKGDSEQVARLLDELEEEVETRCGLLKAQSENAIRQVRNALQIEMMKLPRKIKTMAMREFCDTYSESVSAVMMDSVAKLSMSLKTPRTVRKTKPATLGMEAEGMEAPAQPVFPAGPAHSQQSSATAAPATTTTTTTTTSTATTMSSSRPPLASLGGAAAFSAEKKPASGRTFASRKATLSIAEGRDSIAVGRDSVASSAVHFEDVSSATSSSRKRKAADAACQTPARSTRRSTRSDAEVLRTPAFDPRLPATPRVPNRGESIMSANGSPLGSWAEAGIRIGRNTILVEAEDGKEVNIASPTIQNEIKKSTQGRALALKKLEQLQSQVAALAAQLSLE